MLEIFLKKKEINLSIYLKKAYPNKKYLYLIFI
jgi:hypothetical protein